MSTDQLHPTTSDFSDWLLLNTAKELPVVKYNTKTSLRAWFTNYKQLAESYHVPLQMCIRPSMILLPASIQLYASKLHPSILVDWDQYTNALLIRFGRPAHVEDGETMAKLLELQELFLCPSYYFAPSSPLHYFFASNVILFTPRRQTNERTSKRTNERMIGYDDDDGNTDDDDANDDSTTASCRPKRHFQNF